LITLIGVFLRSDAEGCYNGIKSTQDVAAILNVMLTKCTQWSHLSSSTSSIFLKENLNTLTDYWC